MEKTVAWLLEGDVSVQYMACRDLIQADGTVLSRLRERIASEGFGAAFLSRRNAGGHWGLHYYQPKWTCTHYTLLDLKNLCAPQTLQPCREMVMRMLGECMNEAGGVNLSKYDHPSDIGVDGMILNYASYFCGEDPRLGKLAGHLLSVQRADGGFTWDAGAEAGEPHTTICALEGLAQYRKAGSPGGLRNVEAAQSKAESFLLSNQLFIGSGDRRFRMLSYPYRYRYDLMRVLEYFAAQGAPLYEEIQPALCWLQGKRQKDGLWRLENIHKGNVHFSMEEVRSPSRFLTLKALTVLRHFCN